MTVNDALFLLADSMAVAHSFAESNFRLGMVEKETVFSPPRKKALASWSLYYNATINPCVQIVNNLYPIVKQCEALDAELLKSSRLQIVRKMTSLKSEFDISFKHLLENLNALTGEILLKCFGDSPSSEEKKKASGYFMELQVEVSDKVLDLTLFQENLNDRCAKIHRKIDYADLTGLSISQGPTMVAAVPRSHRFNLIQDFQAKERSQPWYTTASDFITDKDFSIIMEWLRSGGQYTTYADPARWVKLLLDQETSRSFDRILHEKLETNPDLSIDDIMEVLYDLISSRRSMKSCHMSLFQLYNKPGLMGKDGDQLDTFVAQLNHDLAVCKMETFNWTDFAVLIFIKTLISSNKNKEKLAEHLNRIYDATEKEKRTLEIVTKQSEVREFWKSVKENHELTWGKGKNEG